MHNIDRTTLGAGFAEYETEGFNYEFEGDPRYMGETYGEVYSESPFSEAEEMELAAELLSVSNEAELEQFLGEMIQKKGGRGKFGRILGGLLKGAAKKVLPLVGNLIAPGIGGAIGTGLAGLLSRKRGAGRSRQAEPVMDEPDQNAAGGMDDQQLADAEYVFGLELEGLSQEDQEFEIARQFVKFAGAAAENAAELASTMPHAQAAQAVQQAAVAAAKQHAPGLLLTAPPARRDATSVAAKQYPGLLHPPAKAPCQHARRGTWERGFNGRHGHYIILRGV